MCCTSISRFRSTILWEFKDSKSWCKPCKASRRPSGRLRVRPIRAGFAPARIEPEETDAHGEIEHPPPELPGGVPVVRWAGAAGGLQRALEGLPRGGLPHLKFHPPPPPNGQAFPLQPKPPAP